MRKEMLTLFWVIAQTSKAAKSVFWGAYDLRLAPAFQSFLLKGIEQNASSKSGHMPCTYLRLDSFRRI